ncbi:MAG: DUF707 domain-containing protein [Prevotellaceae bacterium]|nr:DUF707 domain-containing protein [Prevotellaceae bacterium]
MKNCLISAVGRASLHKSWISGECDFDTHLIVYDDSIEMHREEMVNICSIRGYKLRVIYKYIQANPEMMEKYDYFFFPDDDIQMDTDAINAIFQVMREYNLKIAQPALTMSYYSWEHTLHDRYCKLRYTNFVEMMVPCFDKEALEKVLFTFNENETGWGAELHWPILINATLRDMAIIDAVTVIHTKPIQSGQMIHNRNLTAYLEKYDLATQVFVYDYIPNDDNDRFCCNRDDFRRLKAQIRKWISIHDIGKSNNLYGMSYILKLFSKISEAKRYEDMAMDIQKKQKLSETKRDEMPASITPINELYQSFCLYRTTRDILRMRMVQESVSNLSLHEDADVYSVMMLVEMLDWK